MRSFFFYDLETSGRNPRQDRIMQFAGQRTDENFNYLGDPVNILVQLPDDTIPSPQATAITGITPQQTHQDGITEAEFCRYFIDEIATPETIFIGYNNVRFDDEFMRNTLWRNFYDPYEWSWRDNRGRWDLLDVTRFVRALRPDGINWPLIKREIDGEIRQVPTVKLEEMARLNGFENEKAHDALFDVIALINLAKLLRDKQPRMWQFLYQHNTKNAVSEVIKPGQYAPFLYTSGRFPSENEKTTAAVVIGRANTPGGLLVWDLRQSIDDFADWSDDQIVASLTASYEVRRQSDFMPLPIKVLAPNRCPAVAPIGVLDQPSQDRINLPMEQIQNHLNRLRANPQLVERLVRLYCNRPTDYQKSTDVEDLIYDGFLNDNDKNLARTIPGLTANNLADYHPDFADPRLPELLLHYKARNYPRSLAGEESVAWDKYRLGRLQKQFANFQAELATMDLESTDQFLLEELKLWIESIMPVDY